MGSAVLNCCRWALAALLLAGLALASSWTVRAALADYDIRQDTIPGLERASRWTPDQAAVCARLAVLVEAQDPPRAMQLLERAVALNPWDTQAWIRLGLRREAAEDLARAETELLVAAQHDRLYLPRWTLANYYFRRGDTEHFWQWAAAAAEMVYDDGTALFRLCGSVQEDGRLIQRLKIRRPEVRAFYLGYLLRTQQFHVLMPVVRTLLDGRRTADVDLLLNASDRLLDRNRVPDALEIWNGLAQARHIRFEPLAPGEGRILTNGRFLVQPTSHGFDWRPGDIAGITATQEDARGGFRVTFSGRQPEHCEIIAQLISLPENIDLNLTVGYRTADMPQVSGLAWRVTDAFTGALLASMENLYSDEGEVRTIRFHMGSLPKLARLSLCYDRPSGAARSEGHLSIQEVGLRVSPPRSSRNGLRFSPIVADL